MKAIVFTLALLSVCAGQSLAQDSIQNATTLAERIADSGSGAIVTVGALPPGWTLPVPVPSMATLLGSVSSPSSGLVTLYYQATDLHATYDAYMAALAQNGFSAQSFEAPLRGFASAVSAGIPAQRTFCKGSYSMYVLAPPSRPGDLRLSIFPPQPNMTQMCGTTRPAIPQRVNPLPLFVPPPGAQFEPITNEFTGQVYSRVPEFAVSAATITGNASQQDLWDAIVSQLAGAGWQISPTITQVETSSAAITLGSGAGAWRGVLMMFPGTKPGTRIAYVSASGGMLTPAQAAQAQQVHLPQLAQPLKTPEEPLLVRLMQRVLFTLNEPQTLYLGRVPPNVDKSIPLPARPPLGSVEMQLSNDPMVANPNDTLYYTLTKNDLREYFQRLNTRGWWQLTSPDNKGSGFYGPQEGGIADFCKSGSSSIMVQTRPDTGVNDVEVSISKPCGSLQQEIAQLADRFGPMPAIVPPPGVTMSPGVPGVPLGVSGAEFRGASSLLHLLDSFSAQFSAAGWKPGAVSTSARIGSRTFTTRRGGRLWQAVITVYASATHPKTYYGFIDLTNAR